MARFYGWTHEYISGLPISVFMDYWLAVDAITASETMNDIDLFCLPHAKKEHRQKILGQLKRRVTSTIKKPGGGLKSMGDIYQQLARKLNQNG